MFKGTLITEGTEVFNRIHFSQCSLRLCGSVYFLCFKGRGAVFLIILF